MTYFLCSGIVVLAMVVNGILISDSGTSDLSYVFDEAGGPSYIPYYSGMPFDEFLWKTNRNTSLWYVDGEWSLMAALSRYEIVLNGNAVDLYTGNYMYPVLKNELLPLNKTYFGFFEIPDHLPQIIDQTGYSRYFADGNLTVYQLVNSKFLGFREEYVNTMSTAFLEWYSSWGTLDQFKIYRHFYFPLGRNAPTWVSLSQLTQFSYPHPSLIPTGETWEGLCEVSTFSTIDFLESGDRVSLLSVDPSIWLDNYTAEQAMFRYYDLLSEEVGFWTPKDLILDREINRVSALLDKKPEETLAIFSNWLSTTGQDHSLYLNYVTAKSYDWVNDPWHQIEYVC